LCKKMPRYIQPSVIGPLTWTFLHLWSKSFPSVAEDPTGEKRKLMLQTFLGILQTLPIDPECGCSGNWHEHFRELGISTPYTPVHLLSVFQAPNSFEQFVFEFHNFVSKSKGKKCPASFRDTQQRLNVACTQSIHGGSYQPCQVSIHIHPKPLKGGDNQQNSKLFIHKSL